MLIVCLMKALCTLSSEFFGQEEAFPVKERLLSNTKVTVAAAIDLNSINADFLMEADTLQGM